MVAPLVEPAAELTTDEVRRYSRHLIIPDVGMTGQKRLKNAKVLVIGAGGLGSPALLYLAAAGVGTLGIIDDDVVDESNLQRQIIHGQSDIDRLTSEAERTIGLDIQPVTLADPQGRAPSGVEYQVYDAGGHNEYQVLCSVTLCSTVPASHCIEQC